MNKKKSAAPKKLEQRTRLVSTWQNLFYFFYSNAVKPDGSVETIAVKSQIGGFLFCVGRIGLERYAVRCPVAGSADRRLGTADAFFTIVKIGNCPGIFARFDHLGFDRKTQFVGLVYIKIGQILRQADAFAIVVNTQTLAVKQKCFGIESDLLVIHIFLIGKPAAVFHRLAFFIKEEKESAFLVALEVAVIQHVGILYLLE